MIGACLLLLLGLPALAEDSETSSPEPVDERVEGAREALVRALVLELRQDQVVATGDDLAGLWSEACDLAREADHPPLVALSCERAPADGLVAAFSAACDAGEPSACLPGAWMAAQVAPGVYEPGARDPSRGAALLRQACDGGVARACSDLGLLVARGLGVDADPAGADALLAAGCEAGELSSCRRMGALLHAAQTVEDHPRAQALYDRACEGGDLPACHLLGLSHQFVPAPPVEEGEGADAAVEDAVEADPAEAPAKDVPLAASLYARACEGGHLPACASLVQLYGNGRDAPRDLDQVGTWLGRACDLGDATACLNLGLLHQSGEIGDPSRAEAPYQRACDLGMPDACGALGVYHLEAGAGLAVAAPLLERACEAGNGGSCAVLGERLAKGRDADPERATEMFARACDREVGAACTEVADRHRKGRGADKDPELARQLYYRACSLGDADGCKRAR